jgi:tripeptidyl-peptidase I
MKFTALLAAAAGLVSAVPDTHVVHEKRQWESSRWVKRGRIADDALLPVRIGLTQTNLDSVHEHLMALSDPKSKKYGQTWTADEVIEAFKPADETVNAVKQWLADEGYISENDAS